MANTYTNCYVHLVFAVKYREALIKKGWKNEMEMYITAIVQNRKHKLLAVSCMPDHIHLLIGYETNDLLPDLVEKIKTSTDHWIRRRYRSSHVFHWQRGYGAFTHSRSSLGHVVDYINNQENHHKNKSFRDEYIRMLIRSGTEYNEKYLFDFFDPDDLSECG